MKRCGLCGLLDGTNKFLMNMGKMLALKFKRAVVAGQDAAQDALLDTV